MQLNVLVNAPFQQGQKKSGVEKGCYFLENIILKCFDIREKHEIFSNISNIENNNDWQLDYKNLYEKLSNLDNYILVGGDHSIGMSSVASSINKISNINNLYVIWIDAHADSNTMQASVTKNIHGQPLAGILGYEPPWFAIKENLPTQNLLYFGIRDLDDFEQQKITEHNIFNTSNLSIIINKIQNILTNNTNAVFHVSFDVDALDSTIMKATGCIVNDGLFPSDIITLINIIKKRLIAFDLVEFNPDLCSNYDLDISYNSIKEILEGIS